MNFPEPEPKLANAYATTYKVPEENSFKGRRMILGHSSNGSADEQKKKLCKADLESMLQPRDKERKIALSISKLKAARYLDFGLEELVPSLWVESEREYDISAVYGITHWWFRRKEFYINKHSEPSDREAVRSQMRILSVISVKVFEKYGYNYLREIILRRADYQEYKISEKDFRNLHPNDFEDLFLLNIQEKLNHLPKTDKTSLHTTVNMWIRNLVIRNRVGDLQLGIERHGDLEVVRRMDKREEAKINQLHREKTTDQKDLSKSRKLTSSEIVGFSTMIDGNPARANHQQALGSFKIMALWIRGSLSSGKALFIFALSFSRAVEAGIFKGYKIDPSTTLSHLVYADDAVFIGEWSHSNLKGTSFWKDLWIGDNLLKLSFPRLFALEENKDISVADKMNTSISSSFHGLGLKWRMVFFKSWDVRSMLDEAFLPKMERSNLSRRNVSLPSLACPLCDHVLEDSSHLFFRCSVAKDIQKLICRWWNLDVHPYE
ncbi:hypothetical protein Tco_0922337 [Tanacetum coccineum]|uniref:Reverse transcriptase zinc-binding domain-containing protein n=1 Tax=Tanacetum coccineum TaxID=301880 RepID=A0ABQ5D137_9ASTR